MSINFLTAPAPRLLVPLVLLGGGIASAMLFVRHRDPAGPPAVARYELALTASTSPGCAWGSAWNDGDVVIGEAQVGRTIRLERTFKFLDLCTWQATEVLEPAGDGRFTYSYEEHLVACDPESTGPAMACTRSGIVTSAPLTDGDAEELTALSGTTEASDPDAWGNQGPRCGIDTDEDDDREDVEDVEDVEDLDDDLTEG